MTTLEKIIEEKAYKMFGKESANIEKFMLDEADLYEFTEHCKKYSKSSATIRHTLRNGLAEDYCRKVLWPRLKDRYITLAVEEIEKRLSLADLPKTNN